MSTKTRRTDEQILHDRLQDWVRTHWDDLTWQDVELFDEVQLTILASGHDACDDERDELQDEIRDLEDELDKAHVEIDKLRAAGEPGATP